MDDSDSEPSRELEVPLVHIESMGRERLGRGTNTIVSVVTVGGEMYAGKTLRESVRSRGRSDPDWISELDRGMERECLLLCQLQHLNIVKAIGLHRDTTADPPRPTLVMEALDGRTLDDYITPSESIDEDMQKSILLDVARGMFYLHELAPPTGPVVHWNLCSPKVLLSFPPNVTVLAKICGFGAACMESRKPYSIALEEQKLPQMIEDISPPEVFRGLILHNATCVDVFSFGILILHLLAQEWPSPKPLMDNHTQITPRTEVERRQQYLNKLDVEHPLKHLIISCLSNKPDLRPTAANILRTIEGVELRKFIPVDEVKALQLSHDRRVFRLQSEVERHRAQEQQLREQLDEALERLEQQRHQYELRLQQLEQERVQLEANMLRVREQSRQLERCRSLPERLVLSARPLESAGFNRIQREQVEIHETLGEGAWAEVAKGKFQSCYVAVKTPHNRLLQDFPFIIERLRREVNIMAQVRHPNLVHFIGAVLDEAAERREERPLIITELLDVNLRRAYEDGREEVKNVQTRRSIFQDVAYGLHCLHSHHEPIIHRDVSTPNILLKLLPNGRCLAKISDFGSANIVSGAITAGEGAILYAAPEMFPHTDPNVQPLPQTTKLDVYSYGIVLCEVIARQLPLRNEYLDMLRKVENECSVLHRLILQCTRQSPDARPTMVEVIDCLNRIPTPRMRHQRSNPSF